MDSGELLSVLDVSLLEQTNGVNALLSTPEEESSSTHREVGKSMLQSHSVGGGNSFTV